MVPPHPKGYVCARTPRPLTIDGDLQKPAWRAAPWTDDFVDIEGDLRPRPRLRTRAKMLWDDTYFYIGAELTEPHVWATLTQHDSVIFHDPDFEVFIDPDGDNHDYGEFEMNALNTTWDLRLPKPYRDGGPALNEWEIPGIKTAVKVLGSLNDPRDTDTGWTLEIAMPWTALSSLQGGGRPQPGQQWRVNFSRVEWDIVLPVETVDNLPKPVDNSRVATPYRKVEGRPEHNWVWSPQGVIDMHRPERWGYVQFENTPKVPFRPDPHWATRCRLMEVYEAQRVYRQKHNRWGTAAELGLPREITLTTTPDGWEARLGGLRLRNDSRLTVEHP